MHTQTIRAQIRYAIEVSPIQYRNLIRFNFELWAFKLSQSKCLLLEVIIQDKGVFLWYQAQYEKLERRFYRETQDFLTGDYDAQMLYEIFNLMIQEINTYPQTLLKQLKNEKILPD